MALTSAGQFFQDCAQAKDPKAFVRKLISDKQAENDWLDFKRYPGSENEPKVKELWFQAISGFANSGGGVLFWGIDCAKNAEGIDAAEQIAPIKGLGAFETRIRELARNATNPPIGNIEYQKIEESNDEGYLVCLVPEGRFKPYRAEITGAPQYYIRAGDTFRIPGPALLRQLFHPGSQPSFRLFIAAESKEIGNDRNGIMQFEIRCPLRLRNEGFASASDCMILVDSKPHPQASSESTPPWNSVATPAADIALKCSVVLHPMFFTSVCKLVWRVPSHAVHMINGTKLVPTVENIDFGFLVFAKDMRPQRFKVRLDGEQLQHGLKTNAMAFPEDE